MIKIVFYTKKWEYEDEEAEDYEWEYETEEEENEGQQKEEKAKSSAATNDEIMKQCLATIAGVEKGDEEEEEDEEEEDEEEDEELEDPFAPAKPKKIVKFLPPVKKFWHSKIFAGTREILFRMPIFLLLLLDFFVYFLFMGKNNNFLGLFRLPLRVHQLMGIARKMGRKNITKRRNPDILKEL